MQQTPDHAQLAQLAQSQAGQQLLSLLQLSADSVQAAADKAAAGDYTQAQQLLPPLLHRADVQALLKQLEEQL